MASKNGNMNTLGKARVIVFCFTLAIGQIALSQDATWDTWPKDAGQSDASIAIPPHFEVIHLKSYSPAFKGDKDNRLILDVRLRSPDGLAEFAVKMIDVRRMDHSPSARRIAWTRSARGETLVEKHSAKQDVNSEGPSYAEYTEDFVVENADLKYTRYFAETFSTGSLPGARSVLWEFKVADGEVRRKYQVLFQRFKASLRPGDD
jgi:hypothetical protein